jgi:hypothetical protein
MTDANGWRPISTAPKDGTRLLADYDFAVSDRSCAPMIVRWMADHHKGAGWYQDTCFTPYHVTHWQPLPPPPGEEGAGDE